MGISSLGSWFKKKLENTWTGIDVAGEQQRAANTQQGIDTAFKTRYQNAPTNQAKSSLLTNYNANQAQNSPLVRMDNGVFANPQSNGNLSAFSNAAATNIVYNNPLSPKAWANWYNSGREYLGTATGNNALRDAGTRGLQERRNLESFNSAQAKNQMWNSAGNAVGSVINAGTLASTPIFKAPVGQNPSTLAKVLPKVGQGAFSAARYGLGDAADTAYAIRQAGGSRAAQTAGGAVSGGLSTALGVYGLGEMFGAKEAGKQGAKQIVKSILKSANLEGTEEVIQNIVDDAVARTTYDKDRSFLETLQNSAAAYVGGAAGGGLISAAGARYDTGKTDQQGKQQFKQDAQKVNDNANHGRIVEQQKQNQKEQIYVDQELGKAQKDNNKKRFDDLMRRKAFLQKEAKSLDKKEKITRNRLGLSMELTNDEELNGTNGQSDTGDSQLPGQDSGKQSSPNSIPQATPNLKAQVEKLQSIADLQGQNALKVDNMRQLTVDPTGSPSSNSQNFLKVADMSLSGDNNDQSSPPKLLGAGGQPPVRIDKEVTPGRPDQKESRFANVTAQESEEVSPDLKKLVKEQKVSYTATTDAERQAYAKEYVAARSDEKAFTDVMNSLEKVPQESNGQENFNAIELIKKLDAKNDEASLFKATEIFHKLSETASTRGQQIQALSALNARTPQGLYYQAQKTLDNALKDSGGMTDTMKKDLKGLIDNVKAAEPGSYEDGLARFKVTEYVSKQVPASKSGKAVQLWKAGLLTSPRTTAGNLAANSFEAVFKKGYVDPVANAFDNLFSIFTGKRSRKLTVRGLASGAGEGVQKGVSYFKTGYDPRNPAKKFDIKNIHYSDTVAGRAAETYTQAVFKLMGAQDQPYYYAALRNSLYDQALTEASNRGLKGQDKSQFVKKFVTEPESNAMELADAEAKYAVFQDDTKLGAIASSFKGKAGAAGEFIVPFSGVPSSIATRMITRTPIGTAQEVVKQIRSGNFDQRKMTAAIANGTAVIPLVAVGAALAKAGLMTLGFPDDKKERELWEAEGKQPYSIKYGNTWLSTNYFQPAGNLLAAGAEYQGQISNGETATTALSTALGGSAQAFTEQSFLQGISGTLNAIQQPERYANRFVEQTAGSIAPNIIRTGARAFDPVARNVNSPLDSFKAGIPGLRQQLKVKNDMFGQPVERRSTALNEIFNPLRPSDAKNIDDSVVAEVRRLQDANEGIIPTAASKTSFPGFDDNQLSDINQEIGSEIRNEWQQVMNDPRYSNLTDADKRKVLDRANDTVYQAIKSQFVDGAKITKRAQSWLNGEDIDYFDTFEAQTETPVKVAKSKKSGGRKGSAGISLPNISIGISSDLYSPVVSRSSYRAPSVRLKNTGSVRVGSRKRGKVKLNAPKKLPA